MKKIISCLALVVLSVVGFSAAAKEASNAQQNTLANVESKTTALAKVVEKTEEIKVSTLEKIEKQLSELDAQKNERMKVEIERDRKGIEFWFAALAIMTTIVAALGALFPYLMARKDKELLQAELQNARDLVGSIKDHRHEAQKIATDMSRNFVSGVSTTEEQKFAINSEIRKIAESPDANEIEKLRARAVSASQFDDDTATVDEALVPYDLWKALTVIKPDDANAFSNAAYWAGVLEHKSASPSSEHWLQLVKKYSEQALIIDPEDYAAASNWSHALDKEANEAAKTDILAAQKLWLNAIQIVSRHEKTAPAGEMAYQLACYLSQLEKIDESLQKLEIARKNSKLPNYWLDDDELINLRKADVYKTWYKTHFGEDK